MRIHGQDMLLPITMVGNYPNPRWYDGHSFASLPIGEFIHDSISKEAFEVELAGRLVRLGSAVVTALTVHADVLAAEAVRHFTAAADLAEELAQRFRLDYRTAYRVVGRAVAGALAAGDAELTAPIVISAARQITGQEIPVTAGLLAAAADAALAVAARQAPGSASPARVREHARRVRRRAAAARRWNAARRARNAQAEADLIAAVTALTVRSVGGRHP